MTSEARSRLRSGDDAETVRVADPREEADKGEESAPALPTDDDADADEDAYADDMPVDDDAHADDEAADDEAADGRGRRGRAGRGGRGGSRLSLPLVPVLAVLFVLLLGATAFLWFTRPAPSSVRTADYTGVLEAARSEVVDFTSFDYLTLDDDIARIKKISVGDLRSEGVDRLNKSRQGITDAQGVSNTQVVGSAVTQADSSHGTVLMVIQSTQKTKASSQPTVTRFRIQVELTKQGGRWLLSGISGR